MNWLRKLLNRFKTKGHTPFTALLRDAFGRGVISKEKAFLESNKGWVFACVNVIGQEIGNIDLKLMEGKLEDDEEDEEIFDHPALAAIHRANSQMTKNELFEITSAHLDLDGNAFWYLLKNDEGVPIEIYPLRPDRVTEVLDEKEPLIVKGYSFVQEGGAMIELDAKDVIPFRNVNAAGRYPFPTRGMGVVEPAAEIIDTDDFARKWNKNFFLNSATPKGVFEYEGDLDSSEMERIQRQWQIGHQGVDKTAKVAFLKDGMKFTEIGINQKDMDFVEGRKFSRDEILAMFRVPKSILGITEDVNRANAEASNFIFGLRVLKPRMQKIVDTLNEFYLPLFGDDDLFFAFESPVPEDRTQILNEYQLGINKWLTRNEIRRREGLPDTEEGDTIFGLFSEVPVDRVKSIKKREKPRLKLKDKKKKPVIKSKFAESKDDIHLPEKALRHFKDIYVTHLENQTRVFVDKLKEFESERKKRILKNLRSELRGLEPSEFALKDKELFWDTEGEAKIAKDLLKQMVLATVKDTSKLALMLVGNFKAEEKQKKPRKVPVSQLIDIDEVNLETEEFDKFLKDRAELFARRTNEEVRTELFGLLESNAEKPMSLSKLEDEIDDILRADRFNTEVVARTEMSAFNNFINAEAYKQSGITKHRWEIVTPEDAPCQIEGQVRNIGKQFSNGLTLPPVHPNCNCFTVPVK